MALEEDDFDNLLADGTGAGLLFGTTGGVMEAALRTVVELVTGEPMGRIPFDDVRGLEGIKEATLTLKPSPTGPFGKYDKVRCSGLGMRRGVGGTTGEIPGGEGSPLRSPDLPACVASCAAGA
jgi:hypothetical protein